MAQRAPLSSPSLQVFNRAGILRLLLLQVTVPATAFAQTPQQQYVFGSVPLRSATSQVAAYVKNGQTGALSAVPGSPFADSLPGTSVITLTPSVTTSAGTPLPGVPPIQLTLIVQ